MNVISGEKIQSLAEVTIASAKKIKFNKNFSRFIDNYIIIDNIDDIKENIEKIKKYKIIFVYGDEIVFFFQNILSFLENIILITHNDDNGIKESYLSYSKNPKIISSEVKLPHKLDQPANPYLKEIELFFETTK